MKIYTKVVFDIESGDKLYEESFEYSGDIALCGGGKGGGGGGDQTITTRYATYVESRHQHFLSQVHAYRRIRVDPEDSPFKDYYDISISPAFFGVGYTISSFPSLYDMYGKFMAGLDVDDLYDQIFEDTVNAPAINDLVSAEAELLEDDIDARTAAFEAGMVNINSVIADSFVDGKVMIEDTRVKALSKFSAELKYRVIPVAAQRWSRHLDWNAQVTMSYAEIMKLYFSAKMDVEDFNFNMAAKDSLWPFTVLDYERAALGALQGATTTEKSVAGGGSSTASNAISGALAGAAMGGMVGSAIGAPGTAALAGATLGLPGAIVGGVLGLAASFL